MRTTIEDAPRIRPGCCGGDLLAHLAAAAGITAPTAPSSPLRTHPAADRTRVLRNAVVLPVDPAFSRHEAIAWRGDRILAVGSEDEVRAAAGEDAEVRDAEGATVLPGFVEPHAHVLPTALFDRMEDVGALRFASVDQVLDHLRSLVPAVPAGGWLMARQLDPALQAGPDLLTRDLLDTVSTDVPVVVVNASLHFAYASSAALRAAGIDRDTPDLPGSPYGRWGDGTPNGVLVGQAAMLSVQSHNPNLRGLDLVAAGRAVTDRAASRGVTTIADQGTGGVLGVGDLDLYAAMAADDGLATRLRYSIFDTAGAGFDHAGVGPGHGDEVVRATGWKIVSDGSNQGRTGHQREPYLGEAVGNPLASDRGIAYVQPEALARVAAERAAAGWQVVIHANGDQAIDDAIAALRGAVASGRPDARHRIEHCSLLHDRQIEAMAALGVSPSFLIGHVGYWGRAFRDDILGPDRADLLGRAASCARAGIRWTMHSDEPVTSIDPLRCIRQAVTRELWQEPGTVLNPAERVPVEAAIRAMTADAAWQCRSEHELGTLAPGRRADVVVLAEDPTTVEVDAIEGIEVLETWMGGVRRH